MRNNIFPIAVLTTLVGLFYITAALHFGYTPDDTYIYLRYAKNLAAGDGFSFNPGQPSYGFTSPLWLLLITGGVKCAVDPALAAKALDLLCASLSLVVMFFLMYEMARDVVTALSATACLSFSGWFLRWAGTGMESSLAVLILLSVFLCMMRNQYLLATVLLALLTLTRPEGGLLLPFALVDLVINSHSRRYAINMAAALVLVYVALLLPWYLVAYSTFGTLSPNTAVAKSGFLTPKQDLLSTAKGIISTVGSTELVIIVMIIAGLVILRTAHRRAQDAGNGETGERLFIRRQVIACAGWSVVLAGFYIIADVNVVSRYLLLMIPVCIALGFSMLSWGLLRSGWKKHRVVVLLVLLLVSIGENEFVYHGYILPGIRRFQTGMENGLLPVALWFKGNVQPGTLVMTGDIGAVGYFGDVAIWDVAGLITPEALPLLHGGHLPYEIIEKKLYRGLAQPAYILDRSVRRERLKDDPQFVPVMTTAFAGMTIAGDETYYFTIYRVVRADESARTAGK
jgi:hypothetical protein